jgi:hypothetical protein
MSEKVPIEAVGWKTRFGYRVKLVMRFAEFGPSWGLGSGTPGWFRFTAAGAQRKAKRELSKHLARSGEPDMKFTIR